MVKQNLEIERRWLLSGLPSEKILGADGVKMAELTTVYVLSDSNLELRIRQQINTKGTSYSLVTKVGSGLTRQESPKMPVHSSLFNYYYEAKKPHIFKNRWSIPLGNGQTLEVNGFFLPSGKLGVRSLVLAEIEFDDEQIALEFNVKVLPVWFKKLVVKEVTSDPRYNSKGIAMYGRPNPE